MTAHSLIRSNRDGRDRSSLSYILAGQLLSPDPLQLTLWLPLFSCPHGHKCTLVPPIHSFSIHQVRCENPHSPHCACCPLLPPSLRLLTTLVGADSFCCSGYSLGRLSPSSPHHLLVMDPCLTAWTRKSDTPSCDRRRCAKSSRPSHSYWPCFCQRRTRVTLGDDTSVSSTVSSLWPMDYAC
jgi:hypothetical protein